ncbi:MULTISPECIES: YheC/YheD family protein [Paenibacillus]|uniref:YheC/YheD family protein n=1 Tax=Paenibacillus campinasensis TaxID=66347 RepID=A0A268ELQ3_9BACL|nr:MULTISPECIES: YheC/YheD family protein [Paenibacillus]MUG68592.1 YheC/YheD family protein [Paenibacillus campinasensis]PAD74050.1 hypothetical protein CHH67_18235 [Paenibacillus campinasensis]PAK50666.1 hypothetical protein CHH75_16780 [Paenibacillus sp. 7541]
MAIQRVASKWAKTKILLQNKGIAAYIPTTRRYSIEALRELLAAHTVVYIKPDRGTYGIGVMSVEIVPPEKSSENSDLQDSQSIAESASPSYRLRYEQKKETFSSIEALHKTLKSLINKREYLAQQGIDLLRFEGRPFDLRVLTQKTPTGQWATTGIIGRVAAKNKIVTNHHSGGIVKHFKTLMSEHMNAEEIENIRQELKILGVNVAAQLQKSYPRLKEIGLDVAIDSRWNIWILEVNTRPALFPFKKFFKDPSIYNTVRKYAQAYGRKLPDAKKAR